MKNLLALALTALMLPAGAATAEAAPASLAGKAAITMQDDLNAEAVADLANLVGGRRSHSCRVNSVAGAVLSAAGLALGSRSLTAIGTHLTVMSMTVCY